LRHLWLISILLLVLGCGDSESNPTMQCRAGAAGESCTPCEAGFYCAGGETPAEACPDGTWDDDADASTACVAWSTCDDGTVSVAGSTTQDQTCDRCGEGEFSDGVSACRAWTTCEAGQLVLSEGSPSQDRRCGACIGGWFSTDSNAESCLEWTTCEAGQFIAQNGTSTTDRTCAACASGTFSDGVNSTACTAWTTCNAGQYVSALGTNIADRTCSDCGPNSYSDSINAGSCAAWTTCNAGQYIATSGTDTTDQTCAACASNTYSSASNAQACTAWTTCNAGQYIAASGTAINDRTCSTCGPSSYTTTANQNACTPWTVCAAGTHTVVGSTTTNTACTPCGVVDWDDDLNPSTECIALNDCVDNEYVSTEPTSTSDRECQPCGVNMVSTGPNATACEDACFAAFGVTCAEFEEGYIKASNTGASDHFGRSVAISGDTMVVGAVYEDSAATGINGNQNNNGEQNSGAVYVFVRSGTTWSQQAYIKASNTQEIDYFGLSVAISGDTIAVGAYGEDSAATGINGDQTNNGEQNSGAVYVFVRSGTTWSQQAYIKASNTQEIDYFGSSVAISGDTLAVGAYGEDSAATGINGDQTNNSANGSGAVYVFSRAGTIWNQQAYIKASNTQALDYFGSSVAISGHTLAVGAHREASAATGVNGDQTNNNANESGAVYVFSRTGTTWSQQAYIKASNTQAGGYFGSSVAISGDTLAVGAYGEASAATGINGDQTNNGVYYGGAVYVFSRTGTTWSQQAYIKASNTEAGDYFGISVAISGDTLAVGTYGEASAATGINGNQTNNSASSSCAVYVFTRTGTTWSQQAYIKASNTEANDQFGTVAISGDTLAVGAYGEASAATGINGDQTNNSASDSGAVYVRRIAP